MNENGSAKPLPLERSAEIDAAVTALRQLHGLDVSAYEENFLLNSLEKRRVDAGYDAPLDYLKHLAQDRIEAANFYHSLNINYSRFFREPLTFAMLEFVVLPALVDANENGTHSGIRIWSAGCAAGQEAWSVAILLENMAAERKRSIPYRIIATDVSERALTLARRGIYDSTELQNTPLKHVQTYFSTHGESYAIIPELKECVDFSYYDLLDEHSTSPAASIYGDFDLVLCSNLLFYYRPEIRQRILDKVCHALRPRGYFVTGGAERDIVDENKELHAVSPFTAIFQKRGAQY